MTRRLSEEAGGPEPGAAVSQGERDEKDERAEKDVDPEEDDEAPAYVGRHFRRSDEGAADGSDDPDEPDGADSDSDDPSADAAWPKLSELPQRHRHRSRGERRRARLRRRLRIAGLVLLVVAVVVGGVTLGVRHMVEAGGRSLREASQPTDLKTVEEADTADDGLTVEYQGRTYRYNENVVSIVVMGYDRRQDVSVTGEAGQADAIIVVALDTQTGEMRVVGVPRDTMVDVDENVGEAFIGQDKMQIALAFSYGDGYETSARNVVRAVSRVLYNMPMNYYFSLNMQGVGPINDAMGGVTLTPLATIPSTGIVEGSTMTLYGNNAMRYVQYRDTSQLDSSLQRQARQSQYLQAFFSQAVSNAAGDPGVLVGLYQTALQYSTTNLGLEEFSYLASVLLSHGMSQLEVTTLGGEAVKGEQYVEYHLDQTSVYETVLDVFYKEEGDSSATAGGGEPGSGVAQGE